MSSTAGVGYSDETNSAAAGAAAAKAALQHAGAESPDIVFLFSSSKHDPIALRDGVRSVVGEQARLFGGYTVGVITNDVLSCQGAQAVVLAIKSNEFVLDAFIELGMDSDEQAVGRSLGKQIAARDYQGEKSLLFMYDSVKKSADQGKPELNLGTPLIQGMLEELKTFPSTAGVGMMGDISFSPIYQWFDDRIEQQSATALVWSGGIRMDTVIMHGCVPASGYHEITKVDYNTVLEIDGRPALDMITEMLGPEASQQIALFATLGVNKGDKFGEFEEEAYQNRLVFSVDEERRGLVMFENDLKAGMEVQLMRRQIDYDAMAASATKMLEDLGSRRPLFALYIDCVGRASMFTGAEREEAAVIQEVIGAKMPVMGFYTGVEIASVAGEVSPLDFTGVLCVFSLP